jgi:hypothetical protein
MEDQASGAMVYVHREHYTNQNIEPHVANPSFKITYAAYNITNTTNLTVKGASIYGAVEGTIHLNELTRSKTHTKSTVPKDLVNHLMTIKNSVVTNGLAGANNGNYTINAKEAIVNSVVTNGLAGANNGNYTINAKEAIVKSLSMSIQGSDPAYVYLFFEPSSLSVPHLYYNIPYCNEVSSVVVGTFDLAVDTPIYSGLVGINGTINVDLSAYRITIPPGSQLSIAVLSLSPISRAECALVWSED